MMFLRQKSIKERNTKELSSKIRHADVAFSLNTAQITSANAIVANMPGEDDIYEHWPVLPNISI